MAPGPRRLAPVPRRDRRARRRPRCSQEHGHERAAPDRQRRDRPRPALHALPPGPARGVEGPSGGAAHAGARLRARGVHRRRRLARGPRPRRRRWGRSGSSPTRSTATRCSSATLPRNARVAEAGHGPGVYEAVVTELAERRALDATRSRCAPPEARAAGAGTRRRRAATGTVVRTSSTHSSSGSSPEMSRASPSVTGACDAAPASSARASSGTDSSDSTACPTRSGISAAGDALGEQLARAAVAALRRERGGDEVAGAGQADDRLGLRAARLRRSARPRRRCGRRRRPRRSGPAPRSRRRRAPRRSSPRPPARRRPGRSRSRTRRPRAGRPAAIAAASGSFADAATRPAPSCTISRACAGPPMTATRPSPSSVAQQDARRPAVGRDEALGQRDHRARVGRPGLAQARDDLVQAARGHAEEDEVRARDARRRCPRCAARAAARRRAGSATFSRSSASRRACSAVRACSVVRRPPRASSTATAVPNEPAPTTTARRPGHGQVQRGSARLRHPRNSSPLGPPVTGADRARSPSGGHETPASVGFVIAESVVLRDAGTGEPLGPGFDRPTGRIAAISAA